MAGLASKKTKPERKSYSKFSSAEVLKAAKSAHISGEIKDAESLYKQVIKMSGMDSVAFANLGVIYKQKVQLDKALSATLKAIEIEPGNAGIHMNLGSILQDQGKLKQALSATLKAIELQPDYAEAHKNLGGILKDQGELDQALDATLKAIGLKPGSGPAIENMIVLLQISRPKEGSINILKVADSKLRRLEIPGGNSGKITAGEVVLLTVRALNTIRELGVHISTPSTQIYCRDKTMSYGCNDYTQFFQQHNAIAGTCFHCYKVQAEPKSFVDFLQLYALFKALRLKNANIRKCMIECRRGVQGTYKGLIYCSSLEEAKGLKKLLDSCIGRFTEMEIASTIKRGCTEFSNAHKDYGIVDDDNKYNLNQPSHWRNLEENHLRYSFRAKEYATINDFNLGDLLIIKNWITYAQAIGDETAARATFRDCDNPWLLEQIANRTM